MDVSDPGKVKETFDWLQDRTDRLDALINNAALQICKPLVEMAAEEWDAVMATNLRAVFLTAKHSHALLVKARGSIVNVSSVHAIATSKEIAAYAASKGGVVALTRAMALEFADRGVRVNAVLPGAVDTDMLREGLDRGHVAGESSERKLEALGGRVALGRVGKAGEIAEAVFFLADSDRSPYTTGQTLVVDGGAIARLSTE
jgi:NAD(P)-dependent dehydrogenase (short-subunit alcohol dehydrogenase family)